MVFPMSRNIAEWLSKYSVAVGFMEERRLLLNRRSIKKNEEERRESNTKHYMKAGESSKKEEENLAKMSKNCRIDKDMSMVKGSKEKKRIEVAVTQQCMTLQDVW